MDRDPRNHERGPGEDTPGGGHTECKGRVTCSRRHERPFSGPGVVVVPAVISHRHFCILRSLPGSDAGSTGLSQLRKMMLCVITRFEKRSITGKALQQLSWTHLPLKADVQAALTAPPERSDPVA